MNYIYIYYIYGVKMKKMVFVFILIWVYIIGFTMSCLQILNWTIDSVELAALIFDNKNKLLNVDSLPLLLKPVYSGFSWM